MVRAAVTGSDFFILGGLLGCAESYCVIGEGNKFSVVKFWLLNVIVCISSGTGYIVGIWIIRIDEDVVVVIEECI